MSVLLLDRCMSCSRCRLPGWRLETCPWCGSDSAVPVPARGDGTIYSYVVVRRALAGPREDHVDHVIATVELAEGCRVLCRGVPGPGVAIGVPVRVLVPEPTDGGDDLPAGAGLGFDLAVVPTAVAGA